MNTITYKIMEFSYIKPNGSDSLFFTLSLAWSKISEGDIYLSVILSVLAKNKITQFFI